MPWIERIASWRFYRCHCWRQLFLKAEVACCNRPSVDGHTNAICDKIARDVAIGLAVLFHRAFALETSGVCAFPVGRG